MSDENTIPNRENQNNVSNDPGSHQVSFDPGVLTTKDKREQGAPPTVPETGMSLMFGPKGSAINFRGTHSGQTATLTWTPFSGLLEIWRMDTHLTGTTWARLKTVSGQSGTYTDAASRYPDPVAYRAKVQGARETSEVVLSKGEFTIAHFPDLHSRSTARDYLPNIFEWLIRHKTDLNLKLVISTGDNVSTTTSTKEWPFMWGGLYDYDSKPDEVVEGQFERLFAANIPILTTPGNHDWESGDKTRWLSYVLPKFFHLNDPGLMARFETMEGDTMNVCMRHTFGLTNLAFVCVRVNSAGSYMPAQNSWALSRLKKFGNQPAIGVTHTYLNLSGALTTQYSSNLLWTDVFSKTPNVVQVMCGHDSTSRRAWWHLIQQGVAGNRVDATLMDTQDFAFETGADHITLLRFKPDINVVSCQVIKIRYVANPAHPEPTNGEVVVPGIPHYIPDSPDWTMAVSSPPMLYTPGAYYYWGDAVYSASAPTVTYLVTRHGNATTWANDITNGKLVTIPSSVPPGNEVDITFPLA